MISTCRVSRGAGGGCRASLLPIFGLSLVALLAAGTGAHAQELPGGGIVREGTAAISMPSGSSLAVTQSSRRAIIDWTGFSIGDGAEVRFDNGSGATLNRVTGGAVSAIDGRLSASGSVYLINPNGVIVGTSGVVDVGGSFVAATLDPGDDGFLSGGDLLFSGDSKAAVVNFGRIGALGGDVALIAAKVENRGAIAAANGTAGLAAGTRVLLRDASLDEGRFVVELGGAGTSAANAGGIAAASIELRGNGGNVYALAGNGAGVIRATGVAARDGRIFLTAGEGAVTAAGTIVARGSGGAGGFVETSGADVDFAGARIDAGVGGTWLVDPTDLIIDQAAGTAIAAALDTGSNVTQSTGVAGTSGNGDIAVRPGVDISWSTNAGLTLSAYRNIAFGANAALASSGGGAVTLRADNSGRSVGNVTFDDGATIATAGFTTIYRNDNPYFAMPYNGHITGSGGFIAYILVNDAASLSLLRDYPFQAFALGRDIDLGGTGFSPIVRSGQFSTYEGFAGILDGLGHSIFNLNVDATIYSGNQNTAGAGLFTVLNGGTVRNLNLIGGTVTGRGGGYDGGVGALAGINRGATISNVFSSVDVIGNTPGFVGGLVGNNAAGTITNSYSSGSVTGAGISYENYHGYRDPITYTFYPARYAGGLAGANAGTITSSYATGAVDGSGSLYVGGFVGGNAGLIDGGYASGRVTGPYISASQPQPGQRVGGFVGTNINNGAGGAIVTNGYWDLGSTGQVIGFGSNAGSITRLVGVGGDTGLDPFASATYSHFAFGAGGTWFMIEGSTRPFLRAEYATTIGNAHQLQLIAMDLGARYTLAADIDLAETRDTSSVWNAATGFDPIGSFTTAGSFQGVLDGAGHTLNGLYIRRAGETGVGLISLIGTSGSVTDLRLTNVDVVGGGSVGALAGGANGAISGTSSSGTVALRYSAAPSLGTPVAGGLVGTLRGTIVRSSSSAAVDGPLNLGGLVGASYGAIAQSHASGAVRVTGATGGGLVGYNSGDITDSYATGSVTGGGSIGGLVGTFGTTTPTTTVIARTYATGLVSGAPAEARAGGLIGSDESAPGTLRDSYWDIATTGQAGAVGQGSRAPGATVVGVGGGTGRDPYARATYGTLSFATDAPWAILDGDTRPLLRAEYATNITDAHQLQLMALDPAATYFLAADIDLGIASNPSEVWRPSSGFVPVGTVASGFTGRLDGRGHQIAALVINRPQSDAVGLFGAVGKGGGVTSLVLAGGSVTGHSLVGALAGSSEGTIYGIRSDVGVTGTGDNVGGLLGTNFGPGLFNASSGGTVTGGNATGGLVGYNTGTIDNGRGTQSVTGRNATGGIAGFNDISGNISNTVSLSTVAGVDYVGGLTGYNSGRIDSARTEGTTSGSGGQVGGIAGLSSGTVVSAQAFGDVAGTAFVGGLLGTNNGAVDASLANGATSGVTYVGGLVGKNDGTIGASHAGGNVTATAEHAGGLVGLSYGLIAGSYAAGAVTGANFTGGLAGFNGGIVDASYAVGPVAGVDLVGGLIGLNDGAGRIQDSQGYGQVSARGYAGGLAGYNSGTIDTAFATGPVVASTNQAGGLVGFNGAIVRASYATGDVGGLLFIGGLAGTNAGTIERSYASGAATGEAYVGGLAGKNDAGVISTSHADGAVAATMDGAGGLVGSNNRGQITRAYATGAVAGRGYVGGLLGYTDGVVDNAYATGSATGSFYVGGVAGAQGAGGTIGHAYAAGLVGRSGAFGGLVGDNAGRVADSYWDVAATGQPGAVGTAAGELVRVIAIGGATGLDPRVQGTYRNFDFANVWTIEQTRTRPYFQDIPQNPPPQ